MMKKKGLCTLLLTGALLVSANTAVFAADVPTVGNGTEDSGATVSVIKNFEFAEGISTPNATFKFVAEKITNDAPDANITAISYSEKDSGNLSNGKYTILKKSAINFGNFPHAGMYEYNVKEVAEQMEGVTYSTTTYKLRVYVANKTDGTGVYVKSITAEDGNTKKDKVLFTNTYVKDGGSGDGKDALTIEKETTGSLADQTKKFDFKLTLTKAATTTENTVKGKIGNQEITFTYGEEKTFKLGHKDKLVFENLPAGTRYVVTEVGDKDGYVPNVTVTENGITNQMKQGTDEADLRSSENGQTNLVGEKENKVIFVNNFSDDNTPITGIIENNMPFILLIGVGVVAFGSLAAVKKRKTVEK